MATILTKIIELSNRIAVSLLKNEELESLHQSELFDKADKDYIQENLTNPKLIKQRAKMLRSIDKKEGWEKIQRAVGVPVRRLNVWKYAAAAAVILFCVSVFLTQENFWKKASPVKPVLAKSEITPGTDKATLVLANGRTVVLGQGLAYHSKGVYSNGKEIIYKNDPTAAEGDNYLTIPRGGQYFIKLADGTQVWLNSESKLKFPTNFKDGRTRSVELVYGEAYFDVSPSTKHKGAHFNVATNGQNVEVLGTEFNIKAYQDESSIYTTLVEGKISLTSASASRILKPNDRLTLNRNTSGVKVSSIDVYNEISWKEGVFAFNDMTLKDIMKVLSRWYDIKVIFENKDLEKITFNGILDRNQKIEEILTIINKTNKIPYEIKEKTITFY